MAYYSESNSFWAPPWYWEPYVYFLGIQDWWKEIRGKKHTQVLKAGIGEVKRKKHQIFRLISSIILVFLLYLFIVKRILAPAITSGFINPSSSELLWGTGLLALASLSTFSAVMLYRLKKGAESLRARGLKVLRARRALLYKEG